MITFSDYIKAMILACDASMVMAQGDRAYMIGSLGNHGSCHWRLEMPTMYVDSPGTIRVAAEVPGAQLWWRGTRWTFSSAMSVTGASVWRDITEINEPNLNQARHALWDYSDYLIIKHLELFIGKKIGFRRLKEIHITLRDL